MQQRCSWDLVGEGSLLLNLANTANTSPASLATTFVQDQVRTAQCPRPGVAVHGHGGVQLQPGQGAGGIPVDVIGDGACLDRAATGDMRAAATPAGTSAAR